MIQKISDIAKEDGAKDYPIKGMNMNSACLSQNAYLKIKSMEEYSIGEDKLLGFN